ncbi:hypothetical protein [Streptomyces chartreusis]|uniref:hypothetical protein n=1 Tax=Streptomyces chartreusis TaxID=1969 RepID=UPI003816DB19
MILAFYGLYFLLVLSLHRLGARPLAFIAAAGALVLHGFNVQRRLLVRRRPRPRKAPDPPVGGGGPDSRRILRAREPGLQGGARTIRSLSVDTLDELRHMVTLLRASGGRAVPR